MLDNLCGLARLRLDEAEAEAFAQKFAGLLDFVERILEYSPQSSDPPLTASAQLDLRKDIAQPFSWPQGTAHSYRVPRIINFEEEG